MGSKSRTSATVLFRILLLALTIVVAAVGLYWYRQSQQERDANAEATVELLSDWRDEAFEAAFKHLVAGEWEQAARIYKEALKRDPHDLRMRAGLTDALFAQQKYGDALEQITIGRREFYSRSESEQTDVDALFDVIKMTNARAFIMFYQEAVAQAEEDGVELIALNPKNYEGYEILALVAEKKGELDRARHYLGEALKRAGTGIPELQRMIERIGNGGPPDA